jgi:hypothetical protein
MFGVFSGGCVAWNTVEVTYELSLDGLFLEGPRINFVPQKLDKAQPHPSCAVEYFVKKTLSATPRP